jgi:hypothetical protein
MASPPDMDASTRVQDFGSPESPHPPHLQVEAPEPLRLDTDLSNAPSHGHSTTTATATGAQADDTDLLSPSRFSINSIRRRPTRSNTVKQYTAVSPTRPYRSQEPGAEPGIDTQQETPLHYQLQQLCDITVVDFADEKVECHELDNVSLEGFLQSPKEDWVACRWINVNGLSWDVIRTLGNHKSLHRLAIEDLMNTKGRTKADWYSDQAFCKLAPLSASSSCFPPPSSWWCVSALQSSCGISLRSVILER